MIDDLLDRHDARTRHDEPLGRTGRRALIVLAVALALVGPFLPVSTFLLIEVILFALFALSLDFVFGYGGLPSFGHAAMFGAGGYAAALLLTGPTQNLAIILPVTFLVGVGVAAFIGWLSVRTHGIYFAFLTLAFAQMLYIVAFNDLPAALVNAVHSAVEGGDLVESVTRGDNGIFAIPRFELAGVTFNDTILYYYLVLAVVVASVAILFRLANSPFGRVVQGIRENENRVAALGYDVTYYKVVAFSLSGGFAGLAGGLYIPLQTVAHPQFLHWTLSGELIVMVLLGGMGSLWGPMLGAAAVVFMEDELIGAGIQRWRLVLGTVFVVVVIFAPEGIAGIVRSLRRDPRAAVGNVRHALLEYVRKVRT